MADVSVNVGVKGLSTFKSAMRDATSSVKNLDAQLKLNEAQLKLNGNEEQYMANKAELLKAQLDAQTKVVANANKALEDMANRGVSKSSKAYQDMQTSVFNAATKLTSIKTELAAVESGENKVKTGAENMNSEMKNIGKGVSWNNISEGLDKITSKLQSGARAAINFGKKLLGSAKDATGWADELNTRSLQTGFSIEELQRMDKVAEFIDTDVDAIINARKRMSKAVAGEGREDIAEIFGLNITGNENPADLFWELGDALVHMEESFDKEAAAQKVFGRSWNELLPLFKAGRDEYEKMLSEQSVLSDEEVQKLGKADDAIKEMEQQIADLKRQFWADNSETVVNLLQWLVDNKNSVITALELIGGAFAAMKIASFAADLGRVVNGFKSLGLIPGGGGGTAAGGSAAGGGSGWLSTAAGTAKNFFFGGAGTPLAVLGAGIAPAIIAQNEAYARSEEKRASRVATAGNANSPDAQFLRSAAEALVLRNGENKDFSGIESLLMGLSARQNQEKAELYNTISTYAPYAGGDYTWNRLQRFWAGEGMDLAEIDELLESVTNAFQAKMEADGGPKFDVQPEVPEDAADQISKQIGTVMVNAVPVYGEADGEHANGLWSVPFDGYHALLHKGERVVPAREVNSSRNFSSNLYVESMYMNNGQDAEGLAAAMAAAQRRTMSGYGS